MLLTGAQANFMLHIASGRAPTGVPVPYDKNDDAIAESLERFGLIERHHVGADKIGACFTSAGAMVFDEILDSMKP